MKIVRFAALMMIATLFLATPNPAAQFNFTPIMTVSEEYNDNIFLTPDNEEDDFITTASLGFNAELLGRTSGLELTYIPSYEWYDEFSDNDGWTHDATGRLWKDISKTTSVELRNAFLRTRDSLSDATSTRSDDPLVAPDIENDRLRRNRQEYYINNTVARLDHQFGAEDNVYTSLRYGIRREVDSPPPTENEDEWDIWEPAIGGNYWFTFRWGMETDLRYSNRDFEAEEDREEWSGRLRVNNRMTRHLSTYVQYEHTYLDYDQTVDAGTDDYHIYLPTVGFNYQLDENTRVDVGVGWYFQDKDNFDDDDDGFVMNAAVDKVWPFRRGLIGATLLSGLDIDDEGSEDLGLRRYASLSTRGEYAFTPRFSGNVNVGYRWDDYPDQTVDRTDQTLFAGAGLEYQALRWMFLNLDYSFRDLSSDIDADEYTENRVILSLTLRPEQPLRLLR